MKKSTLIFVNIAALVIAVFFSVGYSVDLKEEKSETAEFAFASTMDSMKQVSIGYLKSEQEFSDNWAQYITSHNLTLEEAIDFVININSNENVSTHIIDTETMEGISTAANVKDKNDYNVSYQNMSEQFQKTLKKMKSCTRTDEHMHITCSYINPISGMNVVSFCREITLNTDNDGKKEYLLMRVVPIESLKNQWVFPTGYEKAEIGLITREGDYVVRSNAMKSENFMEFIRAFNNLTYPQKDELQAEITENDSGILEYKDARGQDSCWVYITITEDTGWMLLGYIPLDALDDSHMDFTIILVVTGILLLLFAADGYYFMYINKKLKESMKFAQDANAAKTTFLSTMSHDIRTPMNAIIGMTTIASKHIDDKEQIKECLRKVTLASNHLLTLINDILDISKVESGTLTLNPIVFSLAETSANLVNIVRPQVKSKGLDLEVRVHNIKYEYLYADELRLNQIFINLLSNAVKYTPEGGSISLDIEEQIIPETPNAVRLIYTVKDTGIGMSEEFMKVMFTAFSREKDSRVDTIQGTGLGLAITKQMIDIMNGTIDVKSKQNEGSVFKVTLELAIADKMTDDLILPPMHMLVADDDEIFLETAVDTLKSMGVNADTALNGKQALEMAERTDYPLIILDWKMPVMDGIETTKAIRERIGEDVPIIVISSYDWTDIEEEARAAGANGFINKPIFRSTFYYKLNEILRFNEELPVPEENQAEDLKGMNLLIAEDNELNWEIMEEILSSYEITADRAENGMICVQKLMNSKEGTYQAVLMDIQMPVMNGKDAAKEIRKSTIPYVRDMPIIAMTADAFAEDIRACMECGMNGHVAKPIDLKQLFKELNKIKKS